MMTLTCAGCFTDPKSTMMTQRYHFCTMSVRFLMAFVRADSDRWKVVPFGEIFINPSDSKHVMELLGCSGGLGMVITTLMLRWDAFDGL